MLIKAVFDTNILVSSIFWKKGNPRKVVELAIDGRLICFTTVEILDELGKVLRRDFDASDNEVLRQVNVILGYSELITANIHLDIVKKDKDDNKILECAVACGADYIVTGDKHLLDLKSYKQTRIITAAEMVNIVQSR